MNNSQIFEVIVRNYTNDRAQKLSNLGFIFINYLHQKGHFSFIYTVLKYVSLMINLLN